MGGEAERQFFGDGSVVLGQNPMAGRAKNLLVVMDEQAILKDGDKSGLFELAIFEDGGEKDNIKALPLARLSAGIYQRRRLAVDGGGLAIGINLLRI